MNALALAHDGSALFSGGADGLVLLWPLPLAGTSPLPLVGHTASVTALTLRGNRLCSASRDGTVRLWAALRGDCEATLLPPARMGARGEAAPSAPAVLAVALCASVVAAAFANGNVHLWSAAPPHAAAGTLRCAAGVTGALALSSCASPLLCSGGADGSVRLWPTVADAAGRRPCCATLGEHAAAVVALSLPCAGGEDGTATQHVFSVSTDAEVRLYAFARDAAGALRAASLACLATWTPPSRPRTRALTTARMHVEAPVVFTASEDGAVRVWAPPPALQPPAEALVPRAQDWLLCVASTHGHDGAAVVPEASPPLLAAGCADGRVLLWRVSRQLEDAARVATRVRPQPLPRDMPSGTLPAVDLSRADADLFPVPLREERAAARDAALREHDAMRARIVAAARAEEAAARRPMPAGLSSSPERRPLGQQPTRAVSEQVRSGWRGGYGFDRGLASQARVFGAGAAVVDALRRPGTGGAPLSVVLERADATRLLSAAAGARWESSLPPMPPAAVAGGAWAAGANVGVTWPASANPFAANPLPPHPPATRSLDIHGAR